MGNRFDELAKELARGVSRREALRRLGGGLLGAAVAAVGLGLGKDFAYGHGHGHGGHPGGCPSGQTSCNGTCVDLSSSTSNCGVCGTVCPGTACVSGKCCVGHGTVPFGGACSLSTDCCSGLCVSAGGSAPFCL